MARTVAGAFRMAGRRAGFAAQQLPAPGAAAADLLVAVFRYQIRLTRSARLSHAVMQLAVVGALWTVWQTVPFSSSGCRLQLRMRLQPRGSARALLRACRLVDSQHISRPQLSAPLGGGLRDTATESYSSLIHVSVHMQTATECPCATVQASWL